MKTAQRHWTVCLDNIVLKFSIRVIISLCNYRFNRSIESKTSGKKKKTIENFAIIFEIFCTEFSFSQRNYQRHRCLLTTHAKQTELGKSKIIVVALFSVETDFDIFFPSRMSEIFQFWLALILLHSHKCARHETVFFFSSLCFDIFLWTNWLSSMRWNRFHNKRFVSFSYIYFFFRFWYSQN